MALPLESELLLYKKYVGTVQRTLSDNGYELGCYVQVQDVVAASGGGTPRGSPK